MAKQIEDNKTQDMYPASGGVFAYLRVSTDDQDVANQRLGVMEYITAQNWPIPELIEDTASGRIDWRERGVGQLLDRIPQGGILVAAEISRLARSTIQVLEIMRHAAERGVSIHIVKSRLILDGSMSAKITVTILALAAEIEREFIASRTKEALRRRKESGLPMGRPVGQTAHLALDIKAAEIDRYLALKLNKRAIAKLVDVSPTTLYQWLNRRRPTWNT